ncbi:MAG: hypothetical protein HY898_31895 [Deltaproteobacteria bacterium]|nr:hypothetical protein [Deltaproteobacteria bacterium]
MRRSVPLLAVVLSCGLLAAPVVRADGDQSALAETLFREGKRLMDLKNYNEACPKFADSYKTEAATGTLLALALCHEAQGKTASAWAEYNDAAARARNEGSKDREQAARDRAAALESKLSKLTLRIASETASLQGLTVKRDGAVQPSAAWGVPVPVDPGDHTIDVSAPARLAFHTVIQVGPGGDRKEVTVPALLAAPADQPPVASTQPTTQPQPPIRPEPGPAPVEGSQTSTLRTAGWVVGGLGVVGLGLGTVFAVQAMGKNSDSKSDCSGDACGPQGFSDRTDAVSAGNRATVGFLIGGALVAGGVTMILLGGSSSDPKSARLRAAPAVGTGSVGFMLGGTL